MLILWQWILLEELNVQSEEEIYLRSALNTLHCRREGVIVESLLNTYFSPSKGGGGLNCQCLNCTIL
jgi:hypothetical protein